MLSRISRGTSKSVSYHSARTLPFVRFLFDLHGMQDKFSLIAVKDMAYRSFIMDVKSRSQDYVLPNQKVVTLVCENAAALVRR